MNLFEKINIGKKSILVKLILTFTKKSVINQIFQPGFFRINY